MLNHFKNLRVRGCRKLYIDGDTLKGYHFVVLFFVSEFPHIGWGAYAVCSSIFNAKESRSHCHQYDFRTPRPLIEKQRAFKFLNCV